MKRVGITGSLASGKSTVSNFFKEKGHLVISADEINKTLLEQLSVIKNINKILFDEDSNLLDKKRIAKLIFSNEKKKKDLEEFIHPLIYNKMIEQINLSEEKVVFLEIPLLFETNFINLVDYVIVVYLNQNMQIKRLIERDNIDINEAKKRIKSQIPIEEKLLKADYVIDNSKSVKNTKKQLNLWYENNIRRL